MVNLIILHVLVNASGAQGAEANIPTQAGPCGEAELYCQGTGHDWWREGG